jgi:hypothetical protein
MMMTRQIHEQRLSIFKPSIGPHRGGKKSSPTASASKKLQHNPNTNSALYPSKP